MTSSLGTIKDKYYQAYRDYNIEEKVISCFKNQDEQALLKIKQYLPIKNENLIIKIVQSDPDLTKKIINYKKENIDLIEWSLIIELLNEGLNNVRFREKLFLFIINDESESFINALKNSNYEYVKFLTDLPAVDYLGATLIPILIMDKNKEFLNFEKKSGIVFDRKNMCLKYINQKITENKFPKTYESLKRIAENFNIIKSKELLILWEDVKIVQSVALNVKEYGDEYIKIKREIEKNIILEEQEILSKTLNNTSSKNSVKKRI